MDNFKLVELQKTREFFVETKKSLSISGTFREIIEEKMKNMHCNSVMFCNKTGLNKTILSEMKKEDYRPQLKTVVSICVGLKFEYVISEKLLEAAGYKLVMTREIDCAYYMFLIDCKNSKLEVEDYNEYLKAWGFDKKHFLGSQERI